MFWLLVVCAVLFVLILIITIKTEMTFKRHMKVIDAIAAYRSLSIFGGNKPKVEFDDMYSYDYTLFCIWDWGYKHVLPKDKYELIKDYIC